MKQTCDIDVNGARCGKPALYRMLVQPDTAPAKGSQSVYMCEECAAKNLKPVDAKDDKKKPVPYVKRPPR